MTRALTGAFLVLTVTTVLALGADQYRWEERLTDQIVDLPSGLTPILRVIMQAGNPLTVAAVALAFVLVDRPRRAAMALLGGWGAWLSAALAKGLIGRPRPSAEALGFSPEDFVSGSGYPSSHAAIAAALAVMVVTAVGVPRVIKVLVVGAAVLTAATRVHLGVHWPLDVIGGTALGLIVAGLAVVVLDPAPIPAAWPGVGRWPPAPDGPSVTAPTDRSGPGPDSRGTGWGPVFRPRRPERHRDEAAEHEPSGEPTASLRVATFNIRNGRAFDGRHSWPFRRGATAATIAALDADLIGLQEVYAFQRRWLEREVPARGWIGAGRTDGVGRGEQCPITWRPDRLLLEDWDVCWLSDSPDLAGSRFEGAHFPRIATRARFRHRHSNLRFGVINAHLDSHSRADRVRSAGLLVGWVAEEPLPWLVLGDLNDVPDSRVLSVTEAGGLRSVGPTDGRGTIHRFTGRKDGRRIDHVLISDHWDSGQADIPTGPGKRLPSDHWPLVVDVAAEIPNTGTRR